MCTHSQLKKTKKQTMCHPVRGSMTLLGSQNCTRVTEIKYFYTFFGGIDKDNPFTTA